MGFAGRESKSIPSPVVLDCGANRTSRSRLVRGEPTRTSEYE